MRGTCMQKSYATIGLAIFFAVGCTGEFEDVGPQTISNVDPLAVWSSCMNFDDWEESGMGSWATKPAFGGVVCASCHLYGQGGFRTDEESLHMFEFNRFSTMIGGFFVAMDGRVEGAVQQLQSVGMGAGLHPTYPTGGVNGVGDPHFDSLNEFVRLTQQRVDQGDCSGGGYPSELPVFEE